MNVSIALMILLSTSRSVPEGERAALHPALARAAQEAARDVAAPDNATRCLGRAVHNALPRRVRRAFPLPSTPDCGNEVAVGSLTPTPKEVSSWLR